jgi:hypothetical protein
MGDGWYSVAVKGVCWACTDIARRPHKTIAVVNFISYVLY